MRDVVRAAGGSIGYSAAAADACTGPLALDPLAPEPAWLPAVARSATSRRLIPCFLSLLCRVVGLRSSSSAAPSRP